MSAIVSALDTITKKRLGENAHVEYDWSHQIGEKIVQFYFQLVRCTDHDGLEKQLNDILFRLKGNESSVEFSCMYRLIGQTRDITKGKGERDLTYMQIYTWYNHGYISLAKFALQCCVDCNDEHPYGSWKDIKYFSDYILKKGEIKSHELIDYACALMIRQVMYDWESFMTAKINGEECTNLTLVSRWAPREKSKYGWLFKKMAKMWGSHWMLAEYPALFDAFGPVWSSVFEHYINLAPWKWSKTAQTPEQKKRVDLKIRIHWKTMLVMMNKAIDTPQIKFCNKQWSKLEFNRVTSQTLRKNKLAIRNKIKKGGEVVEREHKTDEAKTDRENCAVNYQAHIDAAKLGDTNKKIHGKRCSAYELVRDAINRVDDETTNEQWKSNSTNNGALGDMLSMVDTSGSMECDECIPLYNAIGIGIRIAEKCNEAFRNRLLTFDSNPQWVQMNERSSFCEKARHVKQAAWGMNTNFYKALRMILDTCIENKLQPYEVNKMILVILSDMQIDPNWAGNNHSNMDSMFEEMKTMYAEAGFEAVGEPYTPPHIVFFNLRKTKGFPVVSTEKNVTMFSGYSPTVLNIFCDKGLNALKEFTPLSMLKELLNNDRYKRMNDKVYELYL